MKTSNKVHFFLNALFSFSGLSPLTVLSAPRATTAPHSSRDESAFADPNEGDGAKVAVALIETAIRDKDYLGARILVKKLFPSKISPKTWLRIRQMITREPRLGYDLLGLWDAHASAALFMRHSVKALKSAHELFGAGRFNEAAQAYGQLLTELINPAANDDGDVYTNRRLHLRLLHQYARSLYGARNYAQAYTVYTWMKADYPLYRQVQFEKTWAAYWAGKFDAALGAIAQQKSAWFSRFAEPETYLIEAYIYKRLCRLDDLRSVLTELKQFQHDLQRGEYSLDEWAKSEAETRVLRNLLAEDFSASAHLVKKDERLLEQNIIHADLERRYTQTLARWGAEVVQVASLAQVSLNADAKSGLAEIYTLPDRSAIRALNVEIYPENVQRPEQWRDEIGTYRYLGATQCVPPNVSLHRNLGAKNSDRDAEDTKDSP